MSATWERAKEIFQEASERTPAERGTFLANACGDDTALRAEVDALLAAHDAAGDFLGGEAETITAPVSSLAEGPGTVVGRYKLLQQIGEGGFGTVYMAEQERPVRRKVALKIIKLGMDTKHVIARFEAERQALALMDHPNIARVLDAGATETGRPYFVMELVRGIPITKYCDENNLSTEARLQLFLSVCSAVQHAHQKGIIHRDIKPSNVMVTLHDGMPVPKVIDFGIAKATNQRLTEKTLFTQYHQFIGTPEYMSPEQAEMSGLDVDTRTDIYSLGVLLYELLTGTTPFDAERLRSMAFTEIHRFIREEDPQRPSTRVSTLGETATDTARHRSTDVRALQRALSGDLDWIVMRALEKDRTRRYETANGFMLDIQRYLDSEPVLASPPTPAYRMRKFIRRNRTAVSVAAAIGAALVGGLGLATYGFVQANREREIARQEAEASKQINAFFNDMLASVNPLKLHLQTAFSPAGPAPDVSGTFEHGVSVEQMLLDSIERMDGAFPGKPLLEAHARETIAATLLGLGANDAAIEQFEIALEKRRKVLPETDREVLRSRLAIARAQAAAKHFVPAERIGRAVLRDLEEEYGTDDRLALAAASLYALAIGQQAKFALADSVYEFTLERQRRVLGSDHRDTIDTLVGWAGLYCWRNRGADAEALTSEAYERALDAYGPDDPVTLSAAAMYALSLTFLGRDEEAEAIVRPALARARRVFGDDHHQQVEFLIFALIRSLDSNEHAAEKDALYRERLQHNPSEWVGNRDFGNFLLQQDKVDEAVEVLGAQYDYWSTFEDSNYVAAPRLRQIKLQARTNYLRALECAGRTDELRPLVVSVLEELRRAAEAPDAGADEWEAYAWELATVEPTDLRRPEEALRWATRAVEATRAVGDPHELAVHLDTQAKALEQLGRFEDALEAAKAAVAGFLRSDDELKARREANLRLWATGAITYANTLGDDASVAAIAASVAKEIEGIHDTSEASESLSLWATRLERHGFDDLAQQSHRRALELARAADDSALVLDVLAALGSLRARQGDLDEATALLDEGKQLFRLMYVSEPITWKPHMGYAGEGETARPAVIDKAQLAYALAHAGRLNEAEELISQVRCSSSGRGWRTLAKIHWTRGDIAAAEDWYRQIYRRGLRDGDPRNWSARFAYDQALYGRCLARSDKFAEAEKHLLAAHTRALEWCGPRTPWTIEIAGWIEEMYEDWGKSELAAEWRANGTHAME